MMPIPTQRRAAPYRLAALALAVPLLAACASGGGASGDAVAGAVTAPLADLNVVRADIPAVLKSAQKAPYALPAERACTALGADVKALDAALGADLDTPPTPENPGLIARGADAVGGAAVGALRNTTEGVVPFRGWVRKLTGAQRYAEQVEAAIAAGTVRRAFLKGLAASQGCPPPAAPRP